MPFVSVCPSCLSNLSVSHAAQVSRNLHFIGCTENNYDDALHREKSRVRDAYIDCIPYIHKCNCGDRVFVQHILFITCEEIGFM